MNTHDDVRKAEANIRRLQSLRPRLQGSEILRAQLDRSIATLHHLLDTERWLIEGERDRGRGRGRIKV